MKNSGFTLVETLMVMIILGFVMMAASSLASTVVRSAVANNARVQAIYLTQQCTELLRNVRDSSWRQNTSWQCPFSDLSGVPVVTTPGGMVFTIEPTWSGTSPVADCRAHLGVKIEEKIIDNTKLYEGSQGLTYSNFSGIESLFKRYFTIDAYDAATESIEMTCHTEWEGGRVQMGQKLTNWRKE